MQGIVKGKSAVTLNVYRVFASVACYGPSPATLSLAGAANDPCSGLIKIVGDKIGINTGGFLFNAVAGSHQNGGCANCPAQCNVTGVVPYKKARRRVESELADCLLNHARARFATVAVVIREVRAVVDGVKSYALGGKHIGHAMVDLPQLSLAQQSSSDGRLVGHYD